MDAHNTFTDVKSLEHAENDLSIHCTGGFGSGLFHLTREILAPALKTAV